MTWKKLNNAHFGSSTTFGGSDIDKISKVFDGTTDIDEQDINSSTTIRSGKLKFRNPADTYSYTIAPSAISGTDKTITFPQLTNDSEFLFENASQTISNQRLSNCTVTNPTYLATTGIIQAQYPNSSIPRWGAYQPIGAANTLSGVGKLNGLLSRHIPSGNSAQTGFDPIVGRYTQFTTGSTTNSNAGLFPNTAVPQFRTSKPGLIRTKWRELGHSFRVTAIGLGDFTSVPTVGGPVSIPADTDHAILIGRYTTAYRVAGASGSNSSWINFSQSPDTNWHQFELSWPAGGNPMTAKLDSNEIAFNLYLPNPNVSLYFWFFTILTNGTAGAISLDISGIWIESE